jgi:DNA-nicking Smr family endonuclease
VHRPLSAEERALWAKVIETVRPLRPAQPAAPAPPDPAEPVAAPPASPKPKPAPARPRTAAPKPKPQPGETLDGTWDRRLSRGLVAPDLSVDLHGHNLATAYDLLDRKLDQAIAMEVRLLLLITGKPPVGEPPIARGRIRAAVGDWLAASRHAGAIAAVRGAHPRHGGAGALYIVLRRRR